MKMSIFGTGPAVAVVLLAAALDGAAGHGFLAHPMARNVRDSNFPQRPSGASNIPQGLGHNNANNNEFHGICGDGPTGPQYFATPGHVTATYTESDVVDFEVRITAHHLGYFEFELCDSPDITEDCFKQHQLLRAGCEGSAEECRASWKPAAETELSSATVSHGDAYPNGAPVFSGDHLSGVNFKMQYQLPEGVTCTHCVVRWHYFTTNSCSSPGAGAEEFWNCADIAIEAKDGGATQDTEVTGDALVALTDKLLNSVPESSANRGNYNCATFGVQLQGNPSWSYVNIAPNPDSYMQTLYGEMQSPGYSTACMPGMGAAEGCLFKRDRTISYWQNGGDVPTPPPTAPVPPTPSPPTPSPPGPAAPTAGPSDSTDAPATTEGPADPTTPVPAGAKCVGKYTTAMDAWCAAVGFVEPSCSSYPTICELRGGSDVKTTPSAGGGGGGGDDDDDTIMACVGTTPNFDSWCADVSAADPTCTAYPDHCEMRDVPVARKRRANAALANYVIRGRVVSVGSAAPSA